MSLARGGIVGSIDCQITAKPSPSFGAQEVARESNWRGNSHLVAAVLSQAIKDLHRTNGDALREVFDWFRDSSPEAFGYGWCCDVLGICPVKARKAIFEAWSRGK